MPLAWLRPVHASRVHPDGPQRLFGQFQRNLLFVGTGLLSVLMLLGLAAMIGFQIDRYHGRMVEEFARARLLLEQSLGQHDMAQTRLADMAEFAWSHRGATLPSSEPLRDRYLAQGQFHSSSTDELGGVRTAVGLGTESWHPAELERYLQLNRSLSLIGRLADSEHTSAANTYFFDPSGRFLSLHPDATSGDGRHTLDETGREDLFNHLRTHAKLPSPHSAQDQIPALRSMAEQNRPRLAYGPHPFTKVPSLVTTLHARTASQPIGLFVSFEPMLHIEDVLRRSGSGHLALVGADGFIVASTHATGLPPQAALREVAAVSHDPVTIATLQRNGFVMLASSVPGTPWDLVESYSWRDVVADGRHLLGIGSLLILGSLAALWILVLRLNRRWFHPALQQMDKLYESESLCRMVVERTPTALCLLAPGQSEPLLSNPAMQELMAVAGSSGVRLADCLRAGYLQQRHGELASTEVRFPLTLQPSNGAAPRYLHVEAEQTYGPSQAAVLFSIQDVTALAAREQVQLQAREQAEAESRAKSAFLATVSHEIRTPLHGILGHLELLDRPGLEAPQRMRIQRIRQSADSLLDIIRDVLDLSRMEFEPLGVEPVLFEPETLLERVALLFAPLAYAKGVELDYTIDRTVAGHLRGQEEQIERVLRNLTSNAVKFTGSGRVELRIRQTGDGSMVRLHVEVADSGIGLSVSQQERLFRPFSQADDSIRGRFGGSGLGLFLCRQLCDSMGGAISVQSTLGVGTLFTFEVPVEIVEDAVTAQPLAGHRVLLVSTSSIWRAELGRRLRQWGAQVQEHDPGELSCLDTPPDVPLVIFERGENQPSTEQVLGWGRPTIRVRVDGPLQPARTLDGWILSAYASEALLSILQAGAIPPPAVDGAPASHPLELSQLAPPAP